MSFRQAYQRHLDNLVEETDRTAELLIEYASANKYSRTASVVNDYYRAMIAMQGQALMFRCVMIVSEMLRESNKEDTEIAELMTQLLKGMKLREDLQKIPPPSVWNIGVKAGAGKAFKDYFDSLEEDEEFDWDDEDDDDITIWIDLDDED